MEVFRGQYKQIANKQYEWTKRFIKSQLAGAEQLAIFKVQPNPNHTRTNQGSIRIKGLNAGTPNYKFSTLITQSSDESEDQHELQTKNLKNSP